MIMKLDIVKIISFFDVLNEKVIIEVKIIIDIVMIERMIIDLLSIIFEMLKIIVFVKLMIVKFVIEV